MFGIASLHDAVNGDSADVFTGKRPVIHFYEDSLMVMPGITLIRCRITSYNVCYTKLLRNLGRSHYALVALGDSNYDTFCAAGHQMQALLEGCGAQLLGTPCLIDVTAQDLPEDAADLWLETWLPLLSQL